MKEHLANAIHLAVAFDRNFYAPFYVLLTSLFLNNKESIFYIHTIATGIDDREREAVRKYIEENNCKVFFYSVDEEYIKSFAVLPTHWDITIATYYRLFFPALVPREVSKLIYIDTDAVVIGKLSELYDININGFPVAAASDTAIKVCPTLGIYDVGAYFNAGVLLINTEQWRKQQITEKAIHFIKTFPEKIKIVEQDALNAVLVGNWQKLDCRFNLMYADVPIALTKKEIAAYLRDKVIIHYTTVNKPWRVLGNNRLRYIYHYFVKKTPLANKQKYIDFEWNKETVKRLIKIRLVEFHYSHRVLVKLWRKGKVYCKGEKRSLSQSENKSLEV